MTGIFTYLLLLSSIELTIGFEIADCSIPEPDGPLDVCITVKSGNAIETILPSITTRYDDIEAVGEII